MSKKPYIITYTNLIEFNGRKLAYRKKCLFDITGNTPIFVPVDYHNGAFYNIGGKRLSKNQAKQLVIMKDTEVDLSGLQWHHQIELDKCFNLERI